MTMLQDETTPLSNFKSPFNLVILYETDVTVIVMCLAMTFQTNYMFRMTYVNTSPLFDGVWSNKITIPC